LPPARRGAALGAGVGDLPPEAHGMSDRAKKLAFGALVVLLGAGLAWGSLRFVWYAGPTLAWTYRGEPFELLAPRMLGLALLAPYFVWMIGRSLAALPLA